MYALFFVCANVLSIKNKFFCVFFAILPKINILVMRKILQIFCIICCGKVGVQKKWATDAYQLSIIHYKIKITCSCRRPLGIPGPRCRMTYRKRGMWPHWLYPRAYRHGAAGCVCTILRALLQRVLPSYR